MIRAIICLFAFCFMLCASGCATLGPVPTSPEYYIDVTIDSIPSGADIYAAGEDGQISEKLGTTPFVYQVGLAAQYYSGDKGSKTVKQFYEFGVATRLGKISYLNNIYYTQPIILDIMAIKAGYRSFRTQKDIYTSTLYDRARGFYEDWPPSQRETSWTIPLNPIVQPTASIQQEQEEQQQSQTTVVPGTQSNQSDTASAVGTVLVTSTVEGAEIYVNYIFYGNAPANLKLPKGVYIIEVKKSGYTDFKKELQVVGGGSEQSLRAELK